MGRSYNKHVSEGLSGPRPGSDHHVGDDGGDPGLASSGGPDRASHRHPGHGNDGDNSRRTPGKWRSGRIAKGESALLFP